MIKGGWRSSSAFISKVPGSCIYSFEQVFQKAYVGFFILSFQSWLLWEWQKAFFIKLLLPWPWLSRSCTLNTGSCSFSCSLSLSQSPSLCKIQKGHYKCVCFWHFFFPLNWFNIKCGGGRCCSCAVRMINDLFCCCSSFIYLFFFFKEVECHVTATLSPLSILYRDLHWGNVLVKPTKQKKGSFLLNGTVHSVETRGVLVRIIDYSLSRLEIGQFFFSFFR